MLNSTKGLYYWRFIYRVLLIAMIAFAGCDNDKMDKVVINKSMVPDEIQGWILREKIETYDRETIFNYIDGAGEVYLAYGFQKVFVYHYSKTDEPEITVEIFDMGSDEDAFGVFSYSREEEETGIGQGYEFRGNLLCSWQGHYYICVLADRGTDETENVIPSLAETIDRKLPASGSKPKLIGFLPAEGLVSQNVRYLHTFPCLNYHYFLANENILKLDSGTEVILGEYQPGPTYLLVIKYDSKISADTAYRSFMENYAPDAVPTGTAEIEKGKWLNIKQENMYIIIVLDAPTKEQAVNLMSAFRNKLISSN